MRRCSRPLLPHLRPLGSHGPARRPCPGYGLGGNAMTAEQKSLLIYGTLLTFFALFLAGYLLD